MTELVGGEKAHVNLSSDLKKLIIKKSKLNAK
jgi:hypothetical protein